MDEGADCGRAEGDDVRRGKRIDVDLLAQAILWVQAKEWERVQALDTATRVAERVERNRKIHAAALKSPQPRTRSKR